jgi:hypothetical protein
VELVRKQLSALRMSPDGATREAAKKAQTALTDSQAALTAADVLSGDAGTYSKTIRDAVSNYGAGKRGQTLQGKMNLAELNANSPVGMLDSATNGEALQRTMKQLARPVNNTNIPVAQKLGFDRSEVEAIKQAALGNRLTDAAQVLERLKGGPFTAIPAMGLRQAGGASIKRQVRDLDAAIRSRSAAVKALQLPPPRTATALSALLPALLSRPLQ